MFWWLKLCIYHIYICMLDAYTPSITWQIVLLWCFVFCSFHRMLYIFHVETVVHPFIIILMLYHAYASVRPVLCFSSINLSNLLNNTGFSTPWPHFADNQQICSVLNHQDIMQLFNLYSPWITQIIKLQNYPLKEIVPTKWNGKQLTPWRIACW